MRVPDDHSMSKTRMQRRHSSGANTVYTVLFFAILILFMYGCTAAVRSHGIESCRERGGQPITNSWLSENAWDVRCIESKE